MISYIVNEGNEANVKKQEKMNTKKVYTDQDMKDLIKLKAEQLAKDLKLSFVDACSAMQTASVGQKNEDMFVEMLGELKLESLGFDMTK